MGRRGHALRKISGLNFPARPCLTIACDLDERRWSAAVSQTSRSIHFVPIALRTRNMLRLGFATAALH
jgi:hypothetical protein